ncbi:MAG: hypothetical protein EBR20_08685, partial [Bacteroidetes bacterium]|nr:hypothetical protein [Bacteroidota bacterium]
MNRSSIRLAVLFLAALITLPGYAQKSAILAGHLIDTETGTATADQIIITEHNPENGRSEILAIGSDIDIPDDAEIIDLSDQWVMGG